MNTITGTGRAWLRGVVLLSCLMAGCNNKDQQTGKQQESVTSVKLTGLTRRDIKETETVPATVTYINKSDISAPFAGFITNIYVKNGDYISKGAPLFRLETKEHAIINGDTTLQNTGIGSLGSSTINAPASGYVTNVKQQQGNFVQEGASIMTLVRINDRFVKAFLPLHFRNVFSPGDNCIIILPDTVRIQGKYVRILNQLNSASQSLQALIQPLDKRPLAENMNLQVEFVTRYEKNAMIVPQEAVQSNEKLDSFWVWKIVNDSLAVSVPVKTGIQHHDSVQLFSPDISLDTKLITQGAYGLPDSAKVKVEK